MPVRSKKQWKWLAIHRPDLLKKWQEEAPVDYKKLPKRVKKAKKKGSKVAKHTRRRHARKSSRRRR